MCSGRPGLKEELWGNRRAEFGGRIELGGWAMGTEGILQGVIVGETLEQNMNLCGGYGASALVGGFRVGSRTSGCQRTLDNQLGETNKEVDFCSEPGMSWQVDFGGALEIGGEV